MNMNDKEWNEFWDNEPDEDDDDYTDYGDDIDANNDETFANASEWNEDEHEEMIARDSILSHTIRSNNNRTSNSSRSAVVNNSSRVISNNNNNTNANLNNNNASSSSTNHNHGGDMGSRAYVSSIIGSAGRAGWNSLSDKDLFPNLPVPRQENRQVQSTSTNPTAWQNAPSASERLQLLQLQQQQLLLQRQQQEQQLREQHLLQHQREQPTNQQKSQAQVDVGRQILTVDELERQLIRTRINPQQPNPEPFNLQPELLRRSDWSPFGGKDLFTAPDPPTQAQFGLKGQIPDLLSQTLTLEQQQQILLQQHHLLQQQQLQHMQQMALLKQQQIQQEQRFMSQNPQCFTVEELERQMIAGRSKEQQIRPETAKITEQDTLKFAKINEKHDSRDGMLNRKENPRHQRSERHENDSRNGLEYRNRRDFNDRKDQRDFKTNARDNHRDNREHRHHNRRRMVIVPPQVQLSVIDKAKSLNLTNDSKLEDSLQDRMQMSRDGLIFKPASSTNNDKTNHDGVLTDKERNWLIRIQEKIQADYDDNLDQDYYYLLYFNRSSMTDEVAQKPGPGVLDRRFIPRERLLYNAST